MARLHWPKQRWIFRTTYCHCQVIHRARRDGLWKYTNWQRFPCGPHLVSKPLETILRFGGVFMNKKRFILLGSSIALGLVFFQNCSRISAIDLNKTSSAKSLGNLPGNTLRGIPGAPASNDQVTTVPNTDIVASTKTCASFIGDLKTDNPVGTTDFSVTGHSLDVNLESAKGIIIAGNSGQVSVKSAEHADTITGNSGRVFANALSIQSVLGNSAQELCLTANHLESVKGNSARLTVVSDSVGTLESNSGDTRVTANTIDTIGKGSGTVHVYRAAIGKVIAQSGTICLHNGAKFAGVTEASSALIRQDCPQEQ